MPGRAAATLRNSYGQREGVGGSEGDRRSRREREGDRLGERRVKGVERKGKRDSNGV